MNLLIIVLLIFTFYSSIDCNEKLRTKDFCTLIGEDCIGKKCNYFEKCPPPFIYQCGQTKCARNESDCSAYLDLKTHFNSRYFKTNVKLAVFPEYVEKAFRKQETRFHKFQANIAICEHPVYVWNSSDVCKLAKVCYEKVKISSKSVVHWIFEPAKYKLARIDCPCDLKYNYKCQNEFCATSKRACEVFVDKSKITSNIGSQLCQ